MKINDLSNKHNAWLNETGLGHAMSEGMHKDHKAAIKGMHELSGDQFYGFYKFGKDVAGHDGEQQTNGSDDEISDKPFAYAYTDEEENMIKGVDPKAKKITSSNSEELDEADYNHGFADPNAPKLGAQQKQDFKRQELQHELGHEQNNIQISINGRPWKVIIGKGYADSAEERNYLNNMKKWAEKKSASSGKTWTVSLTGAPVSEGAKVDRMAGHIAKSEKQAGHSSKDAENIAWATLNKRGYLDNKNKKSHNESVYENADLSKVPTEKLQRLWNSHKDEQGQSPVFAQQLKAVARELARRKQQGVTEDQEIDGMAHGEVNAILENIMKIKQVLEQGTSLDGWMYSYITVANDHLNSVAEQIDNPDIRHSEQGVAEGNKENKEKKNSFVASIIQQKLHPSVLPSLKYGRQALKKEEIVPESNDAVNPVVSAITRRILSGHHDLLLKYGPERIMQAIDGVADFVGDVEEIGTSDVSAWVKQVERELSNG